MERKRASESSTEWALDFLAQRGGEASASEVYAEGAAAGHTSNTLKVARRRLGERKSIEVVKADGEWVWRLLTPPVPEPRVDAPSRQKIDVPRHGTLADFSPNPAYPTLTPKRVKILLDAIAGSDTCRPLPYGRACEHAGITLGVFLSARAKFPEFDELVRLAYMHGTDRLEDEASRRAYDGVESAVIFQGQRAYETDPETGHLLRDENGHPIPILERKYSDTMMALMLKSRDPARFGTQRQEVTGAGGGPLMAFLASLPDD